DYYCQVSDSSAVLF
nr:immunoglobulin light chain junction region [Macaca mulatta]MOW36034.1 immunoglobulin light chain junction region [Macaca mulatta]MOW36038.1 immunoglobulin light chain junction region [Macaca mulatta]MOW36039.1 immunoglobulin light chain junction region [Macaca mulatta]MOW36048.1 immunoglobulin light chain junction region [Macaca mulatta]